MTKDEHPTLNLTDDLDNSQLFESLHNYFVEQKKLTRKTNHLMKSSNEQRLKCVKKIEQIKGSTIKHSNFDIDYHSESSDLHRLCFGVNPVPRVQKNRYEKPRKQK